MPQFQSDSSAGVETFCQRNKVLVGKNKINLSYTKDQLKSASFQVWYKYHASSQQLLDNWMDKRISGFRFSWRIENENPPLRALTNEMGRSIRTPGHGDTTVNSAMTSLYQVDLLQ